MLRTGPVGPIVWPWFQQRHPSVAEEMIVGLDRDLAPCLAAARHCKEVLAEANFHPPGWRDLAMVVPDRVEEVEPNQPKSRSLETKHLNERVWPGMNGRRESSPEVYAVRLLPQH